MDRPTDKNLRDYIDHSMAVANLAAQLQNQFEADREELQIPSISDMRAEVDSHLYQPPANPFDGPFTPPYIPEPELVYPDHWALADLLLKEAEAQQQMADVNTVEYSILSLQMEFLRQQCVTRAWSAILRARVQDVTYETKKIQNIFKTILHPTLYSTLLLEKQNPEEILQTITSKQQ